MVTGGSGGTGVDPEELFSGCRAWWEEPVSADAGEDCECVSDDVEGSVRRQLDLPVATVVPSTQSSLFAPTRKRHLSLSSVGPQASETLEQGRRLYQDDTSGQADGTLRKFRRDWRWDSSRAS